ncbi:MAG: CCA tRNA nucleotidyltransferase [Planctomycetota bacterium]|nr:CCA tRNA nucleotidyltransferase [Planctomycetota bacterium]
MATSADHQTSHHARHAAVSIVRRLRDAGHVAYFAGGCVRDELLGLEPVDYDVATDARPDVIQAMFPRTAAVGASFGVVLVKEPGATVEVATFRADGPYSDKRRPDHVEFADAAHDAQRRDFTINALFLDPLAAADSMGGSTGNAAGIHGHVIDHVGGRADLEAGIVRAVGDAEQRLAEDHLRALRAVRFAARYGFAIEEGTAGAIRDHAQDLAGVSRERIGDELRRMLAADSRTRAVELLVSLGLDSMLFGEGPAGSSAASTSRSWVLAALGGEGRAGQNPGTGSRISFPASLAALAFDRGEIGSPAQIPALVRQWRRNLCLSNEESSRLRDVLAGVLEIEAGWGSLPTAQQKRRAASGWFPEALAVVGARDAALERAGDGGLGKMVAADVAGLEADGIGLAPEPMIDGNDLLALGIDAGPVFARVLERVYDAQLDGRVSSKPMAVKMAAELARLGSV